MHDIRIGLTTGFGLAHAVTERFVVRVEYLFTDYGTERYVTPASVTNFTDVSLSTHAVRFGFTYLFGR
jgi:opacity protein-like surface antigen